MIEIIIEPIHLESVINTLGTVLTAIIAFTIMGLNNFYSNKRLKKELKHLASESEKERISRRREEDLKYKLSSLETVLITIQKIRSHCSDYRLHMFKVIFEKVTIEDGLLLMDESLNQLKLAEEGMQVIINIHLEDSPAGAFEIVEHILELYDFNYRSRRLLHSGKVEEALLIFKNEIKPKTYEFRDFLSELEIELCEYITNVRENA